MIDLNSQKYVFIYICSELPMPQLTAMNKYPKKKIKKDLFFKAINI
jgi:hypothetical protein